MTECTSYISPPPPPPPSIFLIINRPQTRKFLGDRYEQGGEAVAHIRLAMEALGKMDKEAREAVDEDVTPPGAVLCEVVHPLMADDRGVREATAAW